MAELGRKHDARSRQGNFNDLQLVRWTIRPSMVDFKASLHTKEALFDSGK